MFQHAELVALTCAEVNCPPVACFLFGGVVSVVHGRTDHLPQGTAEIRKSYSAKRSSEKLMTTGVKSPLHLKCLRTGGRDEVWSQTPVFKIVPQNERRPNAGNNVGSFNV